MEVGEGRVPRAPLPGVRVADGHSLEDLRLCAHRLQSGTVDASVGDVVAEMHSKRVGLRVTRQVGLLPLRPQLHLQEPGLYGLGVDGAKWHRHRQQRHLLLALAGEAHLQLVRQILQRQRAEGLLSLQQLLLSFHAELGCVEALLAQQRLRRNAEGHLQQLCTCRMERSR
ncbi:hypothetical protein L7F22_062529 [Adiantum nelumboides]|nr:hypothetical protein [Adiantum nelumboides]